MLTKKKYYKELRKIIELGKKSPNYQSFKPTIDYMEKLVQKEQANVSKA